MIKNTQGPATLNDIKAFESRHHIVLPKSYIDFILRINGGVPSPSIYENIKTGSSIYIASIFPITHGKIEKVIQREFPYCISIGYMPIAHNAGGDYVLLSIKTGAIYFWDHEKTSYTADGRFDAKDLIYLEDDVDTFIKRINKT